MAKGNGNGDVGPELLSSLNEAKRCCFCQLLKEDAITGQYFVQVRPFLLFLVLCGRSSSTKGSVQIIKMEI